ncbi:hypothetical protein NDA13_002513 [Ustilago tritici]|nr:hypothetical protein NDA13_002513 [Ustilago tritici]
MASSPTAAPCLGTSPTSRWRSATEHDVYADNRDENTFGWVQPDEWHIIAGPNKNNFLRGKCVDCLTETEQPTASSPTQSCGGPSCGYGAQCCAYSRRATHTKGPAQHTPAFLLQSSSNKGAGPSKMADLAKVEQKGIFGVSLIDVIHGRSCRPISLLNLRTFLHFQRQPRKRLPSYFPASDMQSSAIDDFDLNIDSITASPPSPHLAKKKQVAPRLHYDEVDALDFLVAYERYLTKFREQSRSDRLKSPDPDTCKAAVGAYVRQKCKARVSSDLTAIDFLLQVQDEADIPEDVKRQVLENLKPADLGLKPETQPLRVEFDRLVHRYLCSRRHCVLPSSRRNRRKRDSTSSSDTADDGADTPAGIVGSSAVEKMPRLRWMVDVGLISESDLQLSLAECDFSTHPQVLGPIADAVYAYMSQHVVPFFFISVARNLSPNTKRGRLLVGVVCTVLALVFSILLIVTPSPLAPRAGNGTGNILRWWRLVTAPVWCAGLGYILACFTGLCVWLTLRGNREPDEAEERERQGIRSRISGEDVVGFDLAKLQASADDRDMDIELNTNPWMAPEIADILTGITGQKKDKQRRQRSSTDVRGLEEGRQCSKSEVTDAPYSTKVSFENSFAAKKHADISITSPSALSSPIYMDKDAALTMSAAVILHTPRRPSVMIGASDPSGRLTAAYSALDLNASPSVRPSIVRARNSLNDVGQAESLAVNGNSPNGPAMMRQKRVPLLNFSIGIVSSSGNERAEDHSDAPVLTRDALLFDPELAARVTSPTLPTAPLDGSVGRMSGSPHNSPPAATRRKSLAHALLPLKSCGRMQMQMEEDVQLSSLTRGAANAESDTKKQDHALPSLPDPAALSSVPVMPISHRDPREIAPWTAPSVRSVRLPSSNQPLLFALPSIRKSRMSAATSTTAVSPTAAIAFGPKRAYDESTRASLKERLWTAVQRGTGFAVGTERVLDARVRRAQQMKALRIMALNTLLTVVVVTIVVAIP